MPEDQFGSFVAAVPPPLGIGSATLEDGEVVKMLHLRAVRRGGSRGDHALRRLAQLPFAQSAINKMIGPIRDRGGRVRRQ